MGVKLDWDIDAEKGKHKEHREDSQQRSQRYKGVFRLFMVVLAFFAILGGIAYLIFLRYEQVTKFSEQLLIDTVQAEVASLRLGDEIAFQNFQRSATDAWEIGQSEAYNNYQTLKVSSSIVLSGRVIDVEIQRQRARVQVEEIIDGVPYVQTWFYWRYGETEEYDSGWYHVPPDYTFWGTDQDITNDNYSIRYQSLDQETANQIDRSLQQWLADACGIFDCSTLPLITVDIVPAPGASVRWADNEQNAWQMIVPSPYAGRARADMVFDTDLQIDVATLLSNRMIAQLTNNSDLQPDSDAKFLADSITAWFVGRFVQINPETHFIQSVIDTYGRDTIPTILQNLQPTSSISLVASVTGVGNVAELSVDWRDYVLWRLNLEDTLISNGNSTAYIALYDISNPSVRDAANQRYNNSFTANSRTVTTATVALSDTGVPQLIARVQVTRGFESGEEIIVFNLINGNWLRAN